MLGASRTLGAPSAGANRLDAASVCTRIAGEGNIRACMHRGTPPLYLCLYLERVLLKSARTVRRPGYTDYE